MTTPDNPNPEAKPKIGEMPKPRYISGPFNEGGTDRWVGIEAYSPDREVGEFIWFANSKIGDLNDEVHRYHAAAFVTRAKLQEDADVAIGLPIDLTKCDSATGHVEVDSSTAGVYGLYVESRRRPGFSFFMGMKGLQTEAYWRRKMPLEFDEIFQKARAVLPRPQSEKS